MKKPDLEARLGVLRSSASKATGEASPPAPKRPIDQLRDDFNRVFDYWLKAGHMSRSEHDLSYAEVRAAVRQSMHDAVWFSGVCAMFRDLAEQIERDEARAQKIRAAAGIFE